ncbi:MAG: hypothetical protein R2809_12320 [Flavobacteriales bacterium]
MQNNPSDFICLNFANPDMVGHTGEFSAIVKSSVETADACLEAVVNEGKKDGYSFVVIIDHGNADFIVNDDGLATEYGLHHQSQFDLDNR